MRARSALLLALILGVASPAAAVSLFGEVIAEDPTRIRPAEKFTIQLTIEIDVPAIDELIGTFKIFGFGLTEEPELLIPGNPPLLRDGRTYGGRIRIGGRTGVVPVLNFHVNALLPDGPVRIELGSCPACIPPIGTNSFTPPSGLLELRSQGVSLGTSLPIVPEPATLLLLLVGLMAAAVIQRSGGSFGHDRLPSSHGRAARPRALAHGARGRSAG